MSDRARSTDGAADPAVRRIIQAERRRNAEGRRRAAERLERARAEARRLAGRFAEEDRDVRKVILFGSVAEGTVRDESFDIDLAVEGGDHLKLIRLAEESEFKVDVVDLDTVSPAFDEMVERFGTVIYNAHQ